jgi:signal recognition particle subunit SRP19
MEKKPMRKQEKAIIWPAYFDQTKTRKNGRRVAKGLAVPSPKIGELQDAASKLGMKPELAAEAGYPKNPWSKTGMMLVEKKAPKEQLIKKLGKQLVKARSELPKEK